MTEVFEFDTPQVVMTICGGKYTVTVDSRTAEVCKSILDEAKSRLDRIKSGDKDGENSENDICAFFKRSIERLMFPGAVDQIFGERKQNLSDMARLLCFVAARIRDGYMKAAE